MTQILECKSPLRYAGGKSRGVREIFKYIPLETHTLCSPFLGGGSIELFCANKGITVYAYDIFQPLIDFWQCLLNNSKKLSNIVNLYYNQFSKNLFYNLQKNHQKSRSKYDRAAIFYVLNRSSFSGTTLSGGMSPGHPRFTRSSIDRLEQFKVNNLHVKRADFAESLSLSKNHLLYLDPPYILDCNLYGKKGNLHNKFDHEKLAQILHNRDNWILSYNNCKKVRQLYQDYTFKYPKWKYGMSRDKNSREILILSNDLT